MQPAEAEGAATVRPFPRPGGRFLPPVNPRPEQRADAALGPDELQAVVELLLDGEVPDASRDWVPRVGDGDGRLDDLVLAVRAAVARAKQRDERLDVGGVLRAHAPMDDRQTSAPFGQLGEGRAALGIGIQPFRTFGNEQVASLERTQIHRFCVEFRTGAFDR